MRECNFSNSPCIEYSDHLGRIGWIETVELV